MKVKATKNGFYLHKRKPGDVFEFQGIPSEEWMAPVDKVATEAWKKLKYKIPEPKAKEESAAPAPAAASGEGGASGSGGPKSSGDADVI